MDQHTVTDDTTLSDGVASTEGPITRNTACQRCHSKKSKCSGISSGGTCKTGKKHGYECVPQQRNSEKHPDSSFKVNPQAAAEFTAVYYGGDSGFAGFGFEKPQDLAQRIVHSTREPRGNKRGNDEFVSKVRLPPGQRPLRVLVSADGINSLEVKWQAPSDDRFGSESTSTYPAGVQLCLRLN